MFAYALTRKPGRNFFQGLTTANLGPPNYEVIIKQHASYVDALKTSGVIVIELDPQPDYPDAHFVEDTAVVKLLQEGEIIRHEGRARLYHKEPRRVFDQAFKATAAQSLAPFDPLIGIG